MSKAFYAEYANHAMRFYARNTDAIPDTAKASDVEMWESCRRVLAQLSDRDKCVVLALYRSKCSISDAVKCISFEFSVEENRVWRLITKCAKLFAEDQGLI